MKRFFKFLGRRILLPLLLILIGAVGASWILIDFIKSGNDNTNWYDTETGINDEGMVTIGGEPQYIRIRSQDLDNPVIVDLHGGPGGAQSGFSYRMIKPWTEYFTVVEWDQRGAGKSDDRSEALKATMSFERMIADAIEVIEYTKQRLGVEKVILVGHSWGSILGLVVAARRPDLLHAYVGMGQAVAWRPGFDETTRLSLEAARAAGDQDIIDALSALPADWPPRDDTEAFFERISVVQAPLRRYGTGMHALKNTENMLAALAPELLSSPDMPISDVLDMLSPSDTTMGLVEDIYDLDLRTDLDPNFEVPLFFFQGDHDWQTPTSLARPFIESLHAPVKEYIAFERSAHILINEEPAKILLKLVNRVRPLAMSGNSPVGHPVTLVNHVELDIKAPADLVWRMLPGVRTEDVTIESISGPRAQAGWHFRVANLDAGGNVTRNDDIEVLVWEPGKRLVANVIYLPPSPRAEILVNFLLTERGDVTHFQLDSYAVMSVPDFYEHSEQDLLKIKLEMQQQAQDFVDPAYEGFKQKAETAAKAKAEE
jgi:pimeloyl-ACP methyl ester carboxylesterase